MTFLIKLLIAVFGFGILVFFHELGHFIMAIIFKIKVERFSIGMGPAIYGFKIGETFFQIGAVPFGGFCQFKGEESLEDLPYHLPVNKFNEILIKLKSPLHQEMLKKYYQKSLPEVLKPEVYSRLESILSASNNQLLKEVYHFYETNEEYILGDILPDQYEKMLGAIEQVDNNLIMFTILSDLSNETKKQLVRIINTVVNIHTLKDQDSFYGAPAYKRLIVALFGPFMNYIVAIVFLTFLAMGSYQEEYQPAQIQLTDDDYALLPNQPSKEESPAKKAGLMTKDIILKIDGQKVIDYNDISRIIYKKKGNIRILVQRNDQQLIKEVTTKWDPEQLKYYIGVYNYIKPVIKDMKTAVLQNELGLKGGDEIIGIDDLSSDLSDHIVNSFLNLHFANDMTSVFHIKRGNKVLDINVNFSELKHKISKDQFRLVFNYPTRIVPAKNLPSAFIQGFNESNDIIQISAIGLYSLIFKPKKNVTNQLGGPIFIGAIIGNITFEGFKEGFYMGIRVFLTVISYISLALAFFNLLPIPALDGGHIIMSLYEIVIRKPLSLRIINRINMIFFFILIFLALIIAFFDVSKLIPK